MKYLLIILLLTRFSMSSQEYQSFEVDDGVMAYRSFGSGYPVLIINGGPGMNSEGFSVLAEMLSENNRTIIYDQRGTGKSTLNELNSSNFTIELMVKDIEDLRKHLGYDEWIVLGHSFGGMLAYAYAAKHPDRVKAMIQSHSGGMSLRNVGSFNIRNRLNPAENDSLVKYMAMSRRSPGNPELEKKRALFMAKAYLYKSENEEAVAERLLQVNREINGMVWTNMRATNFEKSPEMENFKKDVLILHGLQDVVPIEISENADAILPNSKLVKIEHCGHYGWLDQPRIYFEEVKTFLSNNS